MTDNNFEVKYYLRRIRMLLTQGFNDEELRELVFYEPDFRPVHSTISDHMGKNQVINQVIEYAEQKILMDALLIWAEGKNPKRYERYAPYTQIVSGRTTSDDEINHIPTLITKPLYPIEWYLGPVQPNSPFYISREIEDEYWENLNKSNPFIFYVDAYHQMGRSSFLKQISYWAKKENIKIVDIDLRIIMKRFGNSERNFLQEFCRALSQAFEIDQVNVEKYWTSNSSQLDIIKCTNYLKEFLSSRIKERLIITIDGINCHGENSICENFFDMLRSLYNNRDKELWINHLIILLTCTGNFNAQIYNSKSGLFTIAYPLTLTDFIKEEVALLSDLYSLDLTSQEIDEIMDYVGGQPFLVRLILHHITIKKYTLSNIINKAEIHENLFAGHLSYFDDLLKLDTTRELLEQIVYTGQLDASFNTRPLQWAGLVKKKGKQYTFRNRLYKNYVKDLLG